MLVAVVVLHLVLASLLTHYDVSSSHTTLSAKITAPSIYPTRAAAGLFLEGNEAAVTLLNCSSFYALEHLLVLILLSPAFTCRPLSQYTLGPPLPRPWLCRSTRKDRAATCLLNGSSLHSRDHLPVLMGLSPSHQPVPLLRSNICLPSLD